ncbi:MAG: hypothetical protein AAF193_11415, partial [Bacteroidota bacterium]
DSRYGFKLSVDTEADFRMVERIFQELSEKENFGIEDVTDLLIQKPEILEINKESKINSGFAKSLKEDRKVK